MAKDPRERRAAAVASYDDDADDGAVVVGC